MRAASAAPPPPPPKPTGPALKAYHWDKLNVAPAIGSLWAQADGTNVGLSVDLSELTDLFSAKPAAEKAKPAAKAAVKDSTVRLLHDRNRSQNCEIMLAKFGKMEPNTIVGGVLEMDANVLGDDPLGMLDMLDKYMPEPDEVRSHASLAGLTKTDETTSCNFHTP